MKDFLQMLQDAFPLLRSHPRLMLGLFLLLSLLVAIYRAKELRKRICQPLCSTLYKRIFVTSRWLYVYQDSRIVDDWKYYTSEVAGEGAYGDDIVWKLVSWPNLKTKDYFIVHGAVGKISGIDESQSTLHGRWNIVHDPDSFGIGRVPARGINSWLRRSLAKLLHIIVSI
jgi:hypothetical protein